VILSDITGLELDLVCLVPGPRLEGAARAALPPFADLTLEPAAVWR
jgi:hypothetical protein